jgi:hypothetical protein
VFGSAPPASRALLLLGPSAPVGADADGLVAFAQYLAGRDRAGLVRLPPPTQPPAGLLSAEAAPDRLLYLCVPQPQLCEQLGVHWDSAAAAARLLVLVAPAPGGSSAATPSAPQPARAPHV